MVVVISAVHVWILILLEVEQLSQVLHNSLVILSWLTFLRWCWLLAIWFALWLLFLNWSIWVSTWSVSRVWFVLLLFGCSFNFPFYNDSLLLGELRFLGLLTILITLFILPLLLLLAAICWLLLLLRWLFPAILWFFLALHLRLRWSLLVIRRSLSLLLLLFRNFPWLERSAFSVKCLFFSAVVRSIFWLRQFLFNLCLRWWVEYGLSISECILVF